MTSTTKTLLYAGLAAVAAGFLALVLAWGQVAGEDDVTEQVPWLVVGSGLGLGLVASGLVVVNVATRRQESAEVDRQLQRLAAALEEERES